MSAARRHQGNQRLPPGPGNVDGRDGNALRESLARCCAAGVAAVDPLGTLMLALVRLAVALVGVAARLALRAVWSVAGPTADAASAAVRGAVAERRARVARFFVRRLPAVAPPAQLLSLTRRGPSDVEAAAMVLVGAVVCFASTNAEFLAYLFHATAIVAWCVARLATWRYVETLVVFLSIGAMLVFVGSAVLGTQMAWVGAARGKNVFAITWDSLRGVSHLAYALVAPVHLHLLWNRSAFAQPSMLLWFGFSSPHVFPFTAMAFVTEAFVVGGRTGPHVVEAPTREEHRAPPAAQLRCALGCDDPATLQGPCGNPEHVFCRDCFTHNVENILDNAREGRGARGVPCPLRSACGHPGMHQSHDLVGAVSPELVVRLHGANELAMREQGRLEGEAEARARAERQSGTLERAVQAIVDVSVPTCPGCAKAFELRDGCLAITCECSAIFCALCLARAHSSAQAHAHVVKCSLNPVPGNVFGDPQRTLHVMRRAALSRVRHALDGVPLDVQGVVRADRRVRAILHNLSE